MYLNKPSQGDFTPPPAGTHLAICYRVIDLGTQKVEWQGQAKTQHKLMLSWELPDELMASGEPFTIHKRYTFSTHEKAQFRKDLESWRGRPFTDADFAGPPNGFNVTKLLGVPCLIGVVHADVEGKTYANITSVSKIMKGMPIPELVNKMLFFDLEAFDRAAYESLPDVIKTTIQKSPEYDAIMTHHHVSDDPGPQSEYDYAGNDPLDDPIPF